MLFVNVYLYNWLYIFLYHVYQMHSARRDAV